MNRCWLLFKIIYVGNSATLTPVGDFGVVPNSFKNRNCLCVSMWNRWQDKQNLWTDAAFSYYWFPTNTSFWIQSKIIFIKDKPSMPSGQKIAIKISKNYNNLYSIKIYYPRYLLVVTINRTNIVIILFKVNENVEQKTR